MTTFKYKKEGLGILGESTPRPIATVFLQNASGGWYKFHPYIDSGADITLLPYHIGIAIGLDPKKFKTQTLGGVGGSSKVIYTRVKMRIGSKELLVRVAWAQVEGIPPLLGRADIFSEFKITFDEKKGEITFEEN